jgi:hypothetical protein
MNKLNKILAGIDFSDCLRSALELRIREFVGETGKHPTPFAVAEAANHGHGIAEYARRVHADLLVLGTKGRSNLGLVAEAQPIVSVIPAKTHGHGIAEYCRNVGADLVILGAKGHTNLKYVLLGSTVERLMKEIPCSALVVRPPGSNVHQANQITSPSVRD